MCSLAGFRIATSILSLRKWQLTKTDVEIAFLQREVAERDVFVLPPTKSFDRGKCLCLLLAAAYGLVNVNAKWQVISEQAINEIGFRCFIILSQLFFLKSHGDDIVAVLPKIVNDFLICVECSTIDDVVKSIRKYFKLGTIIQGPGLLLFWTDRTTTQRLHSDC